MVEGRSEVVTAPRKRAVIFDFDGTIADSLPAVIAVFEEMTRRPERFTKEQVDTMRALSVGELLTTLKVPRWKVPILLFRGRRMLRRHLHGITVLPGMRETIQALHKQGIPLYVLSSNSTDNVRSYLKWHKLEQYFVGIYGGASVFRKAPRLLKMVNSEQLIAADSWYVGDETRDVLAARAVGLQIVSVSWGYNSHSALEAKGPDALVDTAKELQEVIEESWKK